MAVPKRRQSRTRRDKRRAHKKLTAPAISTCPQCNEAKRPHRACPNCGTYRGRTILALEEI